MDRRTLFTTAVVLLAGGAVAAGLAEAPAPATAPAATVDRAEGPVVTVHKSPTCGCCGAWEDHLRAHGYTVDSRLEADMNGVKARLGVRRDLASCHTAVVDGYLIEGHVPASALARLLQERPDAKGLAVPGMPAGSPGMEMPDGRTDPYDVLLVHDDGSRSVFQSM